MATIYPPVGTEGCGGGGHPVVAVTERIPQFNFGNCSVVNIILIQIWATKFYQPNLKTKINLKNILKTLKSKD